jgi:hypothetical protein
VDNGRHYSVNVPLRDGIDDHGKSRYNCFIHMYKGLGHEVTV